MITLVTIAQGAIKPVWDLACRTWEPYCKRHGYDLRVLTYLLNPKIAPSWNKCLAVAETLRLTNEPVWWIDADMTVCNQAFPIEQKFPPSSLYLSSDWNGVCCGLFRAEASQWVIDFLNFIPMLGDIADPDQFGKGLGVKWEQNAIKVLMREFPEVSSKIRSLPPSWVNDNPTDKRATDFIWHFGARSNEDRIRLIKASHGF